MGGREVVAIGAGLAALLSLAACGPSGQSSSNATPTAPPSTAPAALTDAQKKALIAVLPAAY